MGVDLPADLVCHRAFRLKEYRPGEVRAGANSTTGALTPAAAPYSISSLRHRPDHNAVSSVQAATSTDRRHRPTAGGSWPGRRWGYGHDLAGLRLGSCGSLPHKPERRRQPYVPPHKQRWFTTPTSREASAAIARSRSSDHPLRRGTEHWGTTATVANRRWHNPDVVKYPYDLAKAARLLEGEGFIDRDGDGVREDPEGHPLEFVVLTNSENNRRGQIGNLVREDWARVGVKVTFSGVAFNDLVRRNKESFDYEAMLLGLAGGGLDPGSGMNVWKSSGTTHYWWPEQPRPATAWEARVDSLMDAQMQELDYDKRKGLYDQVQYIISDMCPVLMCPVRHISVAARNTIGNLKPVVVEHRLLWNADELYLRSPEEMAAR
jgi:peptide/nickel transport system substrate-binding protein